MVPNTLARHGKSEDRQCRQEGLTHASYAPSVVGSATPPAPAPPHVELAVCLISVGSGVYRRHFAHVTPSSRVVADHNTLAGFAAKMGASS